MTGSGRSTSCIAAFGRRSMKGDLFVLTVLRHGSRGLLLQVKGATSLRTEPDNNSPMRRPLFPPTPGQMPFGELCLWAYLSSYGCRTLSSNLFDQRGVGHAFVSLGGDPGPVPYF